VTLGRRPPSEPTCLIPYLTVANVKDGFLELKDVRSIEVTDTELMKWRLIPGDLLLTEGGDPDKLGRGTLWRGELTTCVHQNHIFRVRFRSHELLPEFGAAQVNSRYGKAYFFAHAKQTTGIATINQRVLRAFPLLCPPTSEQARIVAHLGAHFEEIERLEQRARDQSTAVDALLAALLRQAFSGEL
jgi:type I restriction enzyme S subunit